MSRAAKSLLLAAAAAVAIAGGFAIASPPTTDQAEAPRCHWASAYPDDGCN